MLLSEITWEKHGVNALDNIASVGACTIKSNLQLILNDTANDDLSEAVRDVLYGTRRLAEELEKTLERLSDELYQAIKAGINRILNSALKKEPDLPYVICIDLNVPPIEGDVFKSDIFNEVARTIEAKEKKLSEPDGFPATMYIFTNYPHHYADFDQHDPRKSWITTLVIKPKYPFSNDSIARDINNSLNQYGNIPNEFEK